MASTGLNLDLNKMRLLKRPIFFSPSSNLGGAERVLISLLGPWRQGELSGNPSVVCVEDGPLIVELENLNIPAMLVELPGSLRRLGDSPARWEGRVTRAVRMLWAFPSLMVTLRKWKKWLGQRSPAWIHSNGFKTHLLAAWSASGKTPIFWHLHDFVGERPLMRKLLKAAWRPGIQALAISRAVAEDFSIVLPNCPVRVWYNTIDCEKFQPEAMDGSWLDAQAGLPGGFRGLRVGLVATYARWKGHDVFLRACSLLNRQISNKIRFYVIGGPVYQTAGSQWSEAELQDRVRDLGLGDVVGLVPFQKDTARVYHSLDVVVHASTRREPFGLVIAEAMACGKPVVAALHGGAAEIGRDGVDCVGHLPGNPESLAAAVAGLIGNVSIRQELATQARLRVLENFGPEKIKKNWAELLGKTPKP